jgi:hypothetical protein
MIKFSAMSFLLQEFFLHWRVGMRVLYSLTVVANRFTKKSLPLNIDYLSIFYHRQQLTSLTNNQYDLFQT